MKNELSRDIAFTEDRFAFIRLSAGMVDKVIIFDIQILLT